MPEHEREARQIALLTDYERTLAVDPAAPPPPGLDPGLARVAQLMERELGGAQPTRAASPDAAFKVALRQRLAEQVAAQARPVVPPATSSIRPPRSTFRDHRTTPAPLPSAPTVSPNGQVTTRRAATPRTAPTADTTLARPRPLRTAFATGAGWLGAALVILIVILAATLLMRGLPRSTPAVQPDTTPSPIEVPTAPVPTPAANTATPRPVAPSWRSAATMGTPRTNHTATLLPDGRVLVVGGLRAPIFTPDDFLASVEIYDPATDRWSPAAPMNSPRWGHTATLLQDGRLLVAGGYGQGLEGGSLSSVEIYDPRVDRWSAAAPMNTARSEHTATLLTDGRILVVGGYDYRNNGAVTSAEVYDPVADRWASAGGSNTFGKGQTATLLTDGSVFITGGGDQLGNVGSPSARFNPVTNIWEPNAPPLDPGRTSHGAALLPNGQVLIVGGQQLNPTGPPADGPTLATTLRYDPATNSWHTAASLSSANGRALPVLVTLATGQILAVGGISRPNADDAPTTAERYDPATDRWIVVGTLSPRYGHTATRLADGRVLVTGGIALDHSALDTTLLYTDGPAASATPTPSGTPTPAAPLWQPTGAMAVTRAKHTATRLNDGRILVTGGYSSNDAGATAEAEIYDPQTGRWSPTGAMAAARVDHRALLLPDGQVLVAGGFNNSVNHNTTSVTDAERYDSATGLWRSTAAPPVPLGGVSAALLTDGRVLLVTSSPVGTPPDQQARTALLYDPLADNWASLGTVDLPVVPNIVALPDGRALLLGAVGQVNDGTTPALILDPATGQANPVPLPDGRGGQAAILLPNRLVMVAGGVSWDETKQSFLLDTTLFLDPATGRWSAGPSLGTPRANFDLVALADGRFLAVGGANPTGQAQPTSAELYDPQTGQWTSAGTLTSSARAYFAVAPLADGCAIVAGGDAGFVRSEFLASVELFTPPARNVAPTAPQSTPTPAVPPATPTPSYGIVDWNSPSAGLLFYGGRGYRLGSQTLPDGSTPTIGQQIGATLLRLQSGGVFEAGTPIYSVAGQSPDEWLALKDGDRVILYQRDDSTTVLLAGMQVVWGTVQDAGITVCPGYGCPAPEQQRPGTIATAYQVKIDRSLQGRLSPGATIEVRQSGTPPPSVSNAGFAPFRPGDEVLLFLQPAQQQSIGDFSAGDYYWTTTGWIYHVVQGAINPLGRSPDDFYGPPDRFEAAIAELFRDVTPLAPTDPRPTPRPVTTATAFPTALPLPTATPTPTSGP